MPKKNPKTATGGKRKRTPGDKKDQQHKKSEQADLETKGKTGSSGKRKKTNALTISETSTQTLPQASTSHPVHKEGKFNYVLGNTISECLTMKIPFLP